MKTTRHKNLISFWVMVSVFLVLGVALAFAYVNLLTYHPDIFLTLWARRGYEFSFLAAGGMLVMALIVWSTAHGIHRGLKHAILHEWLLANVRKALLESGYYIPIGRGSNKIARLPRLKLTLTLSGYEMVSYEVASLWLWDLAFPWDWGAVSGHGFLASFVPER